MKYPFKIKDDYVIDLDYLMTAKISSLTKTDINLLFKTGNGFVTSFDTEEECTQIFEELVQDCMKIAQQNLRNK